MTSPILPSGRYGIRCADQRLHLAPTGHRHVEQTFVTLVDTLPFQWDVLFDHNRRRYVIRVPKQQSYINIQEGQLVIGSVPEFFDLKGVPGQTSYYAIIDRNGMAYQSDPSEVFSIGEEVIPNIVTAKRLDPARPYLWVFAAVSDPPPGIYSVYTCNDSYFQYAQKPQVQDRFGLKDDSAERWTTFWRSIKQLNEYANGSIVYKVVFFGRHGEGWHNLHSSNKKTALKNEDNGDLQWDASLTQKGFLQAFNVQAVWAAEESLPNNTEIGIPDLSFCSPLTRCLITHTITFAPQLQDSRLHSVVDDLFREKIVSDPESRRRSKDYVNLRFNSLTVSQDFQPGMDLRWNGRDGESVDDVNTRATAILQKIFWEKQENKIFVSITGHHDITRAIFFELGKDLSSYYLHPGHVVPIICRYAARPGILDIGLYTIQYTDHDPSLFAAVTDPSAGQPVVAIDDESPSTWFVKCVDAENQEYIIKYFDTDAEQDKKLYWNTLSSDTSTLSKAEDSSVPVVLSEAERTWRLLPTSSAGVYVIQWINQSESASQSLADNDSSTNQDVDIGAKSKSGSIDTYPLLVQEETQGAKQPTWTFICSCNLNVPVWEWDN
ncbi:hypothetical protein CVT26_014104 [Gymnopilus dilepis]|uniref:Uncharacterized protein n=1 Tax=Gymnopilus dilepis TaxID=231916 RepID=A0A409Y8N2_9AGAR|nr:hypothetical protein CVT26_014104 [Gymnopilus dilepis]